MTEPTEAPPVLAAYRDASWHPRPDTRTPKRGHVLHADGRAACGLVAMMGDSQPAEDVPKPLRCGRSGCRERWPMAHPDPFAAETEPAP